LFPKLNLPEYSFKLRSKDQITQIFDRFRKKYVVLTPEEWVRQNFMNYLVDEMFYPESLTKIETGIKVNRTSQRGDAVIYDTLGKPFVIVECKAPGIKISQDTFDQAARYNMTLKVKYMMITNGINHFCCSFDYNNSSYQFLKEIPAYSTIKELC